MYDKEFIEKVCNLTCTFKDVNINQTTIKYDVDAPFKKYYNLKTIIAAIKKYKNKEWSDKHLANWACCYGWIIEGGFEDEANSDLTSLEQYIKCVISEQLDGMSFFDKYLENGRDAIDFDAWIKEFKTYDKLFKNSTKYTVYSAAIGEFDQINDERYVLFINKEEKEFAIIYSFYDNVSESIEDIDKQAFIDMIERCKKDNYKILPCKEIFYYQELK